MIRTSMPPRPVSFTIYSSGRSSPSFTPAIRTAFPPPGSREFDESMARLTPQFSANRAVRQYTQDYYLPAAKASRARTAKNGATANSIVDWQQKLKNKWGTLRFGAVKVVSTAENHAFEVEVSLGDLQGDDVQVELYANGMDGGGAARRPMTRIRPLANASNGYVYGGQVPANRPAADYTPRILPHRDGARVPLEANQILWQR
jgi:glycogen phosphorylase